MAEYIKRGAELTIPSNSYISKGSYGIVQKIIADNKTYATKIMNIEKEIHPDILKEIDISTKIIHPNIIHSLRSIITNDKKQILIIQKLAEGNLYDVSRKLSYDDRIKLIYQITSAIHFLHQELYLHLDLKLENILLLDGNASVIDFGLGLYANSEGYRFDKQIRGSSAYMSPEIKANIKYNRSTDVWALGLIYLELLNTKFTVNSKDKFIGPDRLNNIKTILKDINDPRFFNIISQMLEPDPNKRITLDKVLNSDLFSNFKKIVGKRYQPSIVKSPHKPNLNEYLMMNKIYQFAFKRNLLVETVFLMADIYHRTRYINDINMLIYALNTACILLENPIVEDIFDFFGIKYDLNDQTKLISLLATILYRENIFKYSKNINGIIDNFEILNDWNLYPSINIYKEQPTQGVGDIRFIEFYPQTKYYKITNNLSKDDLELYFSNFL